MTLNPDKDLDKGQDFCLTLTQAEIVCCGQKLLMHSQQYVEQLVPSALHRVFMLSSLSNTLEVSELSLSSM